MRVGSILALLKLHPDIQKWLRLLPPGTPPRLITERALRSVARMDAEKQLWEVARRWPTGRLCGERASMLKTKGE